jgi:hypothetical protein
MTPEKFVSEVRSAVVDQNATIYRQLFESTTVESVSDPYWKRALTLYASLGERDRVILIEMMRQATVDTVSNVFGILDGSSSLDNAREDFILTGKSDNQKINGNLQDIFLALEERS